jgi:hypothetical protein
LQVEAVCQHDDEANDLAVFVISFVYPQRLALGPMKTPYFSCPQRSSPVPLVNFVYLGKCCHAQGGQTDRPRKDEGSRRSSYSGDCIRSGRDCTYNLAKWSVTF